MVRGLIGGFGLGPVDCFLIAISTLIATLAVLPMGAVIDLPVREYPPLVSMDAATAALVDSRWREYGFEGTPVPTRGAHP